jgi:hypothetical protein
LREFHGGISHTILARNDREDADLHATILRAMAPRKIQPVRKKTPLKGVTLQLEMIP